MVGLLSCALRALERYGSPLFIASHGTDVDATRCLLSAEQNKASIGDRGLSNLTSSERFCHCSPSEVPGGGVDLPRSTPE